MNFIRRYWNQNRGRIITFVVAVVLLILVIQLLNQLARRNRLEREANVLTEEERSLPTQSRIGADPIPVEVARESKTLVEEFVDKCNKGDVQGAYDMLTDDCKEELYPRVENFQTLYYNRIFAQRRVAEIESFVSSGNRHTYYVKFYEDVLATGNAQNTLAHQDYITIDENSTNGKLNLGNFIYKEEINKESEFDGIKITVLEKKMYREREKYTVKVENNSNGRILIFSGQMIKGIYGIGSNGVSYGSNAQEIATVLREVPQTLSRTYEISFTKTYSSGVNIRAITFADIVPDVDAYKQAPEQYDERIRISVEF